MKIKELCNDERPREKLLGKGAETLSNAELLAILLRTGTGKMNVLQVAQEILRAADGRLNGIADMSIEKLCETEGIGQTKAVTIAATFEIGRRTAEERFSGERMQIDTPKTVYRLLAPQLRCLTHEECWVLFLNRANLLIGKERISSGGIESTTFDIKTIVRRALEKKATGIVIIHNHPSGSPLPGTADIKQTQSLKRALSTCDIALLDHVIIAEDSWFSFADEEVGKTG